MHREWMNQILWHFCLSISIWPSCRLTSNEYIEYMCVRCVNDTVDAFTLMKGDETRRKRRRKRKNCNNCMNGTLTNFKRFIAFHKFYCFLFTGSSFSILPFHFIYFERYTCYIFLLFFWFWYRISNVRSVAWENRILWASKKQK